LLILTSLVVAVQQKTAANIRMMARLTADLQDQATIDAIYQRMRGLTADAMTGTVDERPTLNGESFLIAEGGKTWLVKVQDVEGMVDIYLSPPETLALLPIDANAFAASRERALAKLLPGERFPSLAASLARFGADGVNLKGLATQSSQSGSLRLSTLPQGLRSGAAGMAPGVREGEQVVRVTIDIQPAGQ
jgi:hypothetical protein